MSDNRNFAALDWVVNEIVDTLQQARQALEAYVENPRDEARLRFCLTHIHQVHGSLQMVEFHGAAMMAEEMESLTQSMLDGSVVDSQEAQEVLMRSILQFPSYLEKIKASRRDNPLVVLPLLNDLRTVRGENLLTETHLFSPHMAPAYQVSGSRLALLNNREQFQETVRKLRQMYQYAAAGFIRSLNADENLAYLKKVFARLHKLTSGTARQPLWRVCMALAEALETEAVDSSAAIKNLLRQLDRELKILAVHGTRALDTRPDDDLIKNLLYYVARSGQQSGADRKVSPDSVLAEVYKLYELGAALPNSHDAAEESPNLLSEPDGEAVRSVVAALKAELDLVKRGLDVSLGGEERQEALAEASPVLKRIADTLAVLSYGDLRRQVLEQKAIIDPVLESDDELSDDQMMAIAGKVLDVEDQLDRLAAGVEQPSDDRGAQTDLNLSQAQESVLRESRNGLEQTKDAIVEYIASQWQRGHLEPVPTTLRGIRGGLEMIPLERPARVIDACASYVEEQLLERQITPEWDSLDTLADAVTGVEYYLERLHSDRQEENDLLLSLAEESVAELGYPVAEAEPIPDEWKAEAAPDQGAEGSDSGDSLAPLSNVDDLDQAPLEYAQQEDREKTATHQEPSKEPPQASIENEYNVEEEGVNEEKAELASDSDASLDQTTSAMGESDASPPQEAATESDDEIDDEILEIFVEEAEEVSETIAEYFPRWAEDFEDQEALTEFRRAFHTLKGSGRMVGANDIGELAWSVENMLNRVIDGTVSPSQQHVTVIEQVRSLLPDLIEAFQTGRANPHPELTHQYAEQADALSTGETPDAITRDQAAGSNPNVEDEPSEEIAAEGENREPHLENDPSNRESDLATDKVVDAGDVGTISNNADTEADGSDGDAEPLTDSEDGEDFGPEGQLWEIFGLEALTHLQVVEAYIQEMEAVAPVFSPPSDSTQRALHTLKGSAHMADIDPVAQLVTPLERFVKELRTYQVDIDEDILQLLRDGVDYTRLALGNIERGETVQIPRLGQFVARVNELRERFVAPLVRQQEADAKAEQAVDPELLAIFMAEDMNLLLDADQTIDQWQAQPEALEPLRPLQVELDTLTNGARRANQPTMADLSQSLHDVYTRIIDRELPCTSELCDTLKAAHMSLLDLVDEVAVGQNLRPVPEEVTQALEALLVHESDATPDATSETMEVAETPAPTPSDEPEESDTLAPPNPTPDEVDPEFTTEQSGNESVEQQVDESLAETQDEAADETCDSHESAAVSVGSNTGECANAGESAKAADTASADIDENENEIIEIFLEEADELVEAIEDALHEWQIQPENPEWPEELKRSLHTLKGGARLAGMTDLGTLAHDFETLLIELDKDTALDQAFFQRLNQFQDQIHTGVERARALLEGPDGDASAGKPAEESETPAPVDSDPATHVRGEEANIVPFTPKAKTPPKSDYPAPAESTPRTQGNQAAQSAPVQHLAARRSGPQEVIRVSADLLEDLVNLAGETSIARGRIEEQVGDVGLAIDEMDSTIVRLQEQLRRLDIETEAQVLFRQEQLGAHEDFDPLEMDRYSQLQQLSRSLIESASDLLDLKSTLADKNRDTETLLLQQSRINTDLQEGLMRSRMVPFSRLVPRLRRIVRQAAAELDKSVDFELDNVEGELDRSVLERMVAPLEHMLRNAVDHGIETAAERAEAGKPETGRIRVGLSREGGEVLLRLSDDGRGIDLDRVREKAIERGLMSADAQLSDRDIMQFILHAGFSTADKVTQISGRGVGMDVVHSEIKQLGGSMFINSESGQGSEFIVRLPFTVSVNRALMIQIRDDFYAIPLNTIEGIVRINPFELEHYYQDENSRFEYAGEHYQVRYLGAMLESRARPKLDGQTLPLPVVLVRSAEHTMALQVDRLLGSREIVVKTLGVQFGAVTGVSGATVMGDGSVVVILDPHALMREKLALGMPHATLLEPEAPVNEEEESPVKTIMVVDDSVTVRKVTGRFLEREGFNVITAKDGAEALMTLQDQIPDAMLLDIEMPRMDGFEVAKNIRTSSRLQHIPIVMITSRTGQKHRDRAFKLGVDRYLGKPYQEETLLTHIRELLDTETAKA